MPNPPATMTSTASVQPIEATAGMALKSTYDIKKYMHQMNKVCARNNPRRSMSMTLRMPLPMPCKKAAALPNTPDRLVCWDTQYTPPRPARPATAKPARDAAAGNCASRINSRNASRLVTKANDTRPNNMTKSTTRSVMTVPKSKSTGMSSVWFKAAQRANSPDLGTKALEK